jgi:hypothetical protein
MFISFCFYKLQEYCDTVRAFGDHLELALGLFDASMRRHGIGGGLDNPCFSSSHGLSNEWYDSLGDGANDGIQD